MRDGTVIYFAYRMSYIVTVQPSRIHHSGRLLTIEASCCFIRASRTSDA